MTSLAIIEYMFMFDPSNTWQQGSQFEKDLADFFAANGFQCEVVETKGGSTKRVLVITKIVEQPTLTNQNAKQYDERRKQPGSMLKTESSMPLNNARERDFKQGKLLKSKGYVKR